MFDHVCMVLCIIWLCRLLTIFCMDTLVVTIFAALAREQRHGFQEPPALCFGRCSAGITWAFEVGSGRMQEHEYDIKWPHKAISYHSLKWFWSNFWHLDTWTGQIFTDEQMALQRQSFCLVVDDSGCQSFQKFPGRCSHIYAPFPFGERCVYKDGEPKVRCVTLFAKLLWDVQNIVSPEN